jgi:hypothetical protein
MDGPERARSLAAKESGPVELRSVTGVVAAIEAREAGDVLSVRDARGRLLVEVREDGAVVLHVPEGDLILRAETGRVRIEGADGVHVAGPRVTIETPHLRQVVGVLETHAKRIVEKAKDAYRDVEGLSQTRAGQVRIVAQKTFRAIAERVRMRASKDAKVQADKIYLG